MIYRQTHRRQIKNINYWFPVIMTLHDFTIGIPKSDVAYAEFIAVQDKVFIFLTISNKKLYYSISNLNAVKNHV